MKLRRKQRVFVSNSSAPPARTESPKASRPTQTSDPTPRGREQHSNPSGRGESRCGTARAPLRLRRAHGAPPGSLPGAGSPRSPRPRSPGPAASLPLPPSRRRLSVPPERGCGRHIPPPTGRRGSPRARRAGRKAAAPATPPAARSHGARLARRHPLPLLWAGLLRAAGSPGRLRVPRPAAHGR